MLRSLLLLCVLGSSASAESRLGVHLGGGLEGGPITGVPRPDGVAEGGVIGEFLLRGRNWGVGFAAEAVNRLSLETQEEAKVDVTLRWARPDRRVRGGVGAGWRMLTFERDGAEQKLGGVDMIRLDIDLALARRGITGLPRASMGVDFYFSWTFGCYFGELVKPPSGDMQPTSRSVGCGETLTTTYVLGLSASIGSR